MAFLHQEGLGYQKIAERIGYTKAGVQKIISRLKEPPSISNERATRELWRNVAKYVRMARASLGEHEPIAILEAFQTVAAFIEEKLLNVTPETPPTPKEDPKNEPDDTNISPAQC